MLRRTLLAAMLVAFVACVAGAEEKKQHEPGPWLPGAVVALNLSQSAFSSNWSGGDKGSIVWVLNADLKAEKQFSRKFNLDNSLKAAFGQTSRQVADPANPKRKVRDTPQKCTDLILFESVGRFTLDKYLDPYLAFRLDTQFLDQSDAAGRNLNFNPIQLKEAAGFWKAPDVNFQSMFTAQITRLLSVNLYLQVI